MRLTEETMQETAATTTSWSTTMLKSRWRDAVEVRKLVRDGADRTSQKKDTALPCWQQGVPTNYLSLSQGHCALNGVAMRFQPAGLSAKPSIVRNAWHSNGPWGKHITDARSLHPTYSVSGFPFSYGQGRPRLRFSFQVRAPIYICRIIKDLVPSRYSTDSLQIVSLSIFASFLGSFSTQN
jgi:hypothetical protein